MKTITSILLVSVVLILVGCARPPDEIAPDRKPEYSMRLTKTPAVINDDMGLESLADALKDNITRLRQRKVEELAFGHDSVKAEEYIRSLEFLINKIESGLSEDQVKDIIRENFNFYEVQGKDRWGEVLITSYYEPVIPGSRKKTDRLSQPLYKVPDDLVKIHMDKFVDNFERLSPLQDYVESGNRHLYGRLVKSDWGTKNTVVPYYTREEIDRHQALQGRNLELAWVDPIDAFFLHIQGSGTVRFSDGKELRIGYASQNGHTYRAIGKYLYSVIPPEQMSKQTIEKYLRSIPEIDMKNILYMNPSYIFFTNLEGKPLTSFGTEVIEGRTIATDPAYYPKGALAYMEFEIPVFDTENSLMPGGWENTSRFVLDHDTGGAIKGPHRVDLFWGRGKEAERKAGVMKNPGTLYYLAPKKQFLEKLRDPDI